MRYFQYLVGENRGKVVTLKEIDDISKPNMTLYVFDDGFKCNSELIATDIGDKEAVNNHMVLAAVQDKQHIWKFRENKVEETKKIGHYQSQDFEIPDPYFINKEGKRDHEAHTTIIPTAPKISSKIEPESLDSYYLSERKKKENYDLKESAENDFKASKESEIEVSDIPMQTSSKDAKICDKVIYKNNRFKVDFSDPDWFTARVVEVKKTCDGEAAEYNAYDILKYGLKALDDMYAEEDVEEGGILGPAMMLKNCKKEPAEVTMTLTLQLPSTNAYKLIKENYPEDWSREFVDGIIMKLSTAEIRESMFKALLSMYEASSENSQILE